MIKVGAVFPQSQIGNDVADIRRYATAVEALGLRHLLVYDHVVGGSVAAHPKLAGRTNEQTPHHEPFSLISYLAAITSSLEFTTGVLILPQRQTVLVARQAATVDLLSGGRLRLGVGIGWNDLEYQALNENFKNRARRFEEQIELLRALWIDEIVSYAGRWHHVDHAGLQPLPIQRPIPLWIGGSAEPAVRRAARLADGFFIDSPAGPEAAGRLAILRDELERQGRDPGSFGLDIRIAVGDGDADRCRRAFSWCREQGITHVSFATKASAGAVDDHLRQLEAALDAITGL